MVGSFDLSRVVGEFDKKYLQPLNLIDYSNKFEIVFYYNYFKSDKIYADMISNLSKSNFKVIALFILSIAPFEFLSNVRCLADSAM